MYFVLQSLWICLICGHVGCGRYVDAHAYSHFEDTQHTYSLQLGNQRVWDYAGGQQGCFAFLFVRPNLKKSLSQSYSAVKNLIRKVFLFLFLKIISSIFVIAQFLWERSIQQFYSIKLLYTQMKYRNANIWVMSLFYHVWCFSTANCFASVLQFCFWSFSYKKMKKKNKRRKI